MRLTLSITTKYIDHNPTASMTKNSLAGIPSEHPSSIKLQKTDNRIKQSAKCKQSKCPWTQECCFLPSGNNTSTTLEETITSPD
jgi:hypothetical protein